jgi:hypothetical protein
MLSSAVLLRLLALVTFLHFASAAAVVPLLKHQVEELASHPENAENLLNRRQSSVNASSGFTVITGIQGTGTQPRLEIRQLEKNPDQWNIFLLGMARFMRSNQSEKLSYYQVAGGLQIAMKQRVQWLTCGRHPRQAVRSVGWRPTTAWTRSSGILCSSFAIVSSLAQAVHGALRGSFPMSPDTNTSADENHSKSCTRTS